MAQRKPYNPNTAYGRRKLREEAQKRYEEMPESEKQEFDEGVAWMRFGLFIIAIIIFIAVVFIAGPEAAIKWLK